MISHRSLRVKPQVHTLVYAGASPAGATKCGSGVNGNTSVSKTEEFGFKSRLPRHTAPSSSGQGSLNFDQKTRVQIPLERLFWVGGRVRLKATVCKAVFYERAGSNPARPTVERWPSGLWHFPAKKERFNSRRGFKSLPLRLISSGSSAGSSA